MTAADKLIAIADDEVGYLEKRSNAGLYDKTANAGSGNYTKYWADIAPEYQAQPWCAGFITWCLVKAFGRDTAEEMLGHYPYVYCPTGENTAKRQGRWSGTPSAGAIVIFNDSSGTASHTGIVYGYDGSRIYTIEGNTSAGSAVIANGGAVCRKSYSRGYSRIAGYWDIDYSIAESEGLTVTQYEELKQLISSKDDIINKMGQEIAALQAAVSEPEMVYNYIDENMPEWAREAVRWCTDNGVIRGTGEGLGLDDKDLKWCTIIYRLMSRLKAES